MQNWKRYLVTSLVLICLIVAGCSESKLRQASVAIRNFAISLEAVQEGFEKAHAAGFVSDVDYQQAQDVIGKVAVAGSEAVQAIRVAKSKPDALKALDTALQSVDRLLDEGLTGIKNENTKQSTKALILALRGTITTAQAFLQ